MLIPPSGIKTGRFRVFLHGKSGCKHYEISDSSSYIRSILVLAVKESAEVLECTSGRLFGNCANKWRLHWNEAQLTLRRDGNSLRFILLRTRAEIAQDVRYHTESQGKKLDYAWDILNGSSA